MQRTLALLLLLALTASSPSWAGSFNINGTLLFQDGDPNVNSGFPGLTNIVTIPARAVTLHVRTSDGDLVGRGSTAGDGSFRIAVNAPNDKTLEIFAEVDNAFARINADNDFADERLEHRVLATPLPVNIQSDQALGTMTVAVNYQNVSIIDNPPPSAATQILVSFSAALNVNEVIMATFSDAMANRDPTETDTIGQVDVEYCDSSWNHYLWDIVLTCSRVNNVAVGKDFGYVDKTIAHEYTHHLQYEIGTWDWHAGGHPICTEIDTDIYNDPEFAWSEAFADYNAFHLVVGNTAMSKVDVWDHLEDGCVGSILVPPGSGSDSDRTTSIQGNIVAALWDLSDGLGQSGDAWDHVDGSLGAAANGHRRLFQLFDKELDYFGGLLADAPDVIEFYDAWTARIGQSNADGRPALDSILNRLGIFPGGALGNSVAKMAAEPLIEANPFLPSGYSKSYDANSPIPLTVQRNLSFLGNTGATTEFNVRIGLSNLGVLNMLTATAGAANQASSASFATSVQHVGFNGWLTVEDISGGPASGSLSNAQELKTLKIRFLPAANNLFDRRLYQADVNVLFTIRPPVGPAFTSQRTIRVLFNFIDGPNGDLDQDGLSNQRERTLAGSGTCPSPSLADSDRDLLNDSAEVNTYRTNPCASDTDRDGYNDFAETRESCFRPLVADSAAASDSDPDGDVFRTAHEGTRGTAVCRADTDNDTFSDASDNCPNHPNDQANLDGDEYGDVCDVDADNDGCERDFDMNDLHRDPLCVMASADRWQDGRFFAEFDQRLAFLDGFDLDKALPQGRMCGALPCPPPGFLETGPDASELKLVVRSTSLDLPESAGFAWSAIALKDLNGDGSRDLAIAAPWANARNGTPQTGAVFILSGKTGAKLGQLDGEVSGGRFGLALAAVGEDRLAIGAPGTTLKAGSVFVYRLGDMNLERSFQAGLPGDEFGSVVAALGDWDVDGVVDLAIGAPRAEGAVADAGVVYTALSSGPLKVFAQGNQSGDRFGAALVAAGDTNGNGKAELLIGAPGATRIVQGAPSGSDPLQGVGEAALVELGGTRLWIRGGRAKLEQFGSALAAVTSNPETGEVLEFLVGAPGARFLALENAGRGYVVRADGSSPGFISGTNANARLGRHVAAGPDFYGEGKHTLVLVEPLTSANGVALGRSTFFRRFEPNEN